MKLKHPENLTPPQISDAQMYEYFESISSDWTEAQELYDDWQMEQVIKEVEAEAIRTGAAYFYEGAGWAVAPTPPTMESVKRAEFKDKTFRWNGR